MILLSLVLIFVIPSIVSSETVTFEPPTKYDTLSELIEALTNFIFVIALVAAPLVFLIGGFFFLTSGGDANKVQQGKNIMIYAAVGFAIILSVKGLVELIKNVLGVEESTVYFKNSLFLGIINLRKIKKGRYLKNIFEL